MWFTFKFRNQNAPSLGHSLYLEYDKAGMLPKVPFRVKDSESSKDSGENPSDPKSISNTETAPRYQRGSIRIGMAVVFETAYLAVREILSRWGIRVPSWMEKSIIIALWLLGAISDLWGMVEALNGVSELFWQAVAWTSSIPWDVVLMSLNMI